MSNCRAAGNFSAASWTRFSPTWRKPARTAAAMASAGCVFEIPINVISSAWRLARSAVWAMLSRTRARFSAMLDSPRITSASGSDPDERSEAAGWLSSVGAMRKEAVGFAPRADTSHFDVLGCHARFDERLAIRLPEVQLAIAEQLRPVAEGLANVLTNRVATRPDRRSNSGDDIARARSEHLAQRLDGGARRAHRAAAPPRVHSCHSLPPGIGQQHGRAVREAQHQRLVGRVRHQHIA